MNPTNPDRRLSDEELDREMKAALLVDAPGDVSNELRAAIAAVPAEQPRVKSNARRRMATVRALLASAAAVALIAVAVGVLWTLRGGIAGPGATPTPTASAISQSPTLSSPSPAPTSPTASATLAPSESTSTGLVAYPVVKCSPNRLDPLASMCSTDVWIAASDGTAARDVYAGGSNGAPMGWSADGSTLLLQGDGAVVLVDATGSEQKTFSIWCPDKPPSADGSCAGADPVLCTYPCSGADGFALSPDGQSVAFVRAYPDVENASVLAVLDVKTGAITELTSTRSTNPVYPNEGATHPKAFLCNTSTKLRTCQGYDGNPKWSADGRQIVFERQTMSPEPGATWDSAALYEVDADGGNLRRVTPSGLYAREPSWSPDGTRLAFVSDTYVLNAAGDGVQDIKSDVYTIGLDGGDVTRLTDDGVSAWPNWTTDGRLVFARMIGQPTTPEQWIADADGGNKSQLGGSLADLSAAGCSVCAYSASSFSPDAPYAYWQPVP